MSAPLERRTTSDELGAEVTNVERRTAVTLRGTAALVGILALAVPAAGQVAVRAATVHTMAGAAITDGVILIGANGKIERVGKASDVQVPGGYRTLTATVATPGLIDAHTVVGLAGALRSKTFLPSTQVCSTCV